MRYPLPLSPHPPQNSATALSVAPLGYTACESLNLPTPYLCQVMPSGCMMLTSLPVLAIAVLVGFMAGTSPGGVSPPLVPGASLFAEVPPWPIFRIAVGLNDMLRGAAEATTLPKVRVFDLATARFQSQ
eukprot:scaffold118429_cov59-Phaeocystis_antarctica.AAC.14